MCSHGMEKGSWHPQVRQRGNEKKNEDKQFELTEMGNEEWKRIHTWNYMYLGTTYPRNP